MPLNPAPLNDHLFGTQKVESWSWKRWFTDLDFVIAHTNQHNNLSGLQGGSSNQYYHASAAQYANLHVPTTVLDSNTIDFSISGQQVSGSVIEANISHANLSDLQGGQANQYYHLTSAQHADLGDLGDFTEGSVIFANSDGSLTQDNANVFWDNTNKRLGIGTESPDKRLTISGNTLADSTLSIDRTDDPNTFQGMVQFQANGVDVGAVGSKRVNDVNSINLYPDYGTSSTNSLSFSNEGGITVSGTYTAVDGNINAISLQNQYTNLLQYTASGLVFAAVDSSITIPSGNWDTFEVGNKIEVFGSTNNDGTFTIATVDGLKITVTEAITNETTIATCVVCWKGDDFNAFFLAGFQLASMARTQWAGININPLFWAYGTTEKMYGMYFHPGGIATAQSKIDDLKVFYGDCSGLPANLVTDYVGLKLENAPTSTGTVLQLDIGSGLSHFDDNIESDGQVKGAGYVGAYLRPASDSTTALQLQNSSGSAAFINLDTWNGRVGIFSTAPTGRFQIDHNDGFGIMFKMTNVAGGTTWHFNSGDDGYFRFAQTGVIDVWSFAPTTGFFGLRTTTPRTEFDMIGTMRLTYTDNAIYSSMNTDANGDLNISTSNAVINCNDSYLTTTGNINSGTQYEIGGTSVLDISGANNVHVGGGTGTSGTRCVAVGNQAAISLTSSANDNVYVGYRSGASSNTGDSIVAIGANSCFSLTSNGAVTAVGFASLSGCTASFNTGVGTQVGFQLTSGTNNDLTGYQTGYAIGSGSNNTLHGSKAGRYITGSNNVALGFEAGYGGGTHTGCVFIGHQTARNIANLANEFWLDNSSTATPLLHGDFANDTLQINGDFTANGTLTSVGVATTNSGRVCQANRITANTTLDNTYNVVFCDTDGGVFTVTLPAAPVNGTHYKIINCGNTGNILTVEGNGKNLYGSANQTVSDGENIDIHYETTENWW